MRRFRQRPMPQVKTRTKETTHVHFEEIHSQTNCSEGYGSNAGVAVSGRNVAGPDATKEVCGSVAYPAVRCRDGAWLSRCYPPRYRAQLLVSSQRGCEF